MRVVLYDTVCVCGFMLGSDIIPGHDIRVVWQFGISRFLQRGSEALSGGWPVFEVLFLVADLYGGFPALGAWKCFELGMFSLRKLSVFMDTKKKGRGDGC